MIRVSVLYPNEPGKKFDCEYFVTKHFDLVKSKLGSALVFGEGNKGLGGGAPGSPAPFVAVGQLVFDSLRTFRTPSAPTPRRSWRTFPITSTLSR